MRQMARGRIRQVHPAIALQLLLGPLFLHLLTREMFVAPIGEMPPVDAVIAQIVTTFLDGVVIRLGERDAKGGTNGDDG